MARDGSANEDLAYGEKLSEQRLGYEAYADRYDRLVGRVTRDDHYRRALVRAMDIPLNARVLLVACGTGRDLAPIEAPAPAFS